MKGIVLIEAATFVTNAPPVAPVPLPGGEVRLLGGLAAFGALRSRAA